MKVAGQACSIERAYDLLVANDDLVATLEATPEERDRLATYATLRSHHDYMRDLEAARRGY